MADKRGLEKLDFGALSIEQQQQLRQFKINTRINNEKYLREHPETEALISDFLRPTDIREYAADYFTDPNLGLIIGSKLQGDPADTGTD
ncbi:RIIa domain-containing protein 1 isoform X2 [Oncorhynchus kisutch]|uniref:RIIa domain-containing protein 1 isoform X2 n=1 Tax=Oncorhynchus kisutch TaxID=8019 RepID=UPI0012DF5D8E|nr:RIIa domain-containing protein 1 isoform X2 [Oncorhynchus kisutch]